jgi:uncharacterized protein (DUF305 family)
VTDTVDSVGSTLATETATAEPPSHPARRSGVPFLPAIFLALALLLLGVGVGTWWANRQASPGAVDIGFYDDMSTHHLQAIRMANIYAQHGDNDSLRARAEEIAYFQSGDVREMQNALADWNEEGTPDTAMEWMGEPVPQGQQPGMATPEQLADLEAARGLALDDLFTRLMIEHHAGGIHMAEFAEEHARLGDVRELARSMAANQEMEIGELNHVRQDLGLPLYEPTGS